MSAQVILYTSWENLQKYEEGQDVHMLTHQVEPCTIGINIWSHQLRLYDNTGPFVVREHPNPRIFTVNSRYDSRSPLL
jgi:hypothetical protein